MPPSTFLCMLLYPLSPCAPPCYLCLHAAPVHLCNLRDVPFPSGYRPLSMMIMLLNCLAFYSPPPIPPTSSLPSVKPLQSLGLSISQTPLHDNLNNWCRQFISYLVFDKSVRFYLQILGIFTIKYVKWRVTCILCYYGWSWIFSFFK